MTLDEFFSNQPLSRQLFEAVHAAIEQVGEAEMRVSKSQVAFRRKRTFAAVWMPEQYLHRKAAPLVITFSFPHRDPSPRWKEIVEPAPGRFTHHLELWAVEDVDEEVVGWLRQAWAAAG